MPPPPAQPPTADAPIPSKEADNVYTRQLEQRRRTAQAVRGADESIAIRRNADAAAFASLMRSPPASTDAGHAAPRPAMPAPTPPSALTRAFEQAVAQRLRRVRNGSAQLGYADRAALFRRAAALGLSRFDANLLMARVLHYHEQTSGAAHAARPDRSSRIWVWILLTVLAVQAALGLVWLCVLGK